jgi:hypothetical protein
LERRKLYKLSTLRVSILKESSTKLLVAASKGLRNRQVLKRLFWSDPQAADFRGIALIPPFCARRYRRAMASAMT